MIEQCDRTSMLGDDFKCLSSQTCMTYWSLNDNRCNDISDNDFRHSNHRIFQACVGPRDFMCINGTCAHDGHCNGLKNCMYGEDEYMCDSGNRTMNTIYREQKELDAKKVKHKLELFWFPAERNTVKITDVSVSTTPRVLSNNLPATIAFECNRGVGVYMFNGSTACFCPPQYYGHKCQYHNDRLTVLLHINLSRSVYTQESDRTIVLKLLVLFLFHNQTLAIHEFHVRPAIQITVYEKKMTHFPYSRSLDTAQEKRARFVNRTNIINEHPYSVRVEAYELKTNSDASIVAAWQYFVYFDYLPVFRLAKVLTLTQPRTHANPCFSNPCNKHQQCQPILNQNSTYVCLCRANYRGENCSVLDQMCTRGYCSPNALCKPDYRSLLERNELPYCLCALDQFGRRCHLFQDGCSSNPCQNGGSCFSTSRPDMVLCLCSSDSQGQFCELKKSTLGLFINQSVEPSAGVIQAFDIDPNSLDLILDHQSVYFTLPAYLEYQHYDVPVTQVILVKHYHNFDHQAEIHLISVQRRFYARNETTQMTEQNRRVHVRTLFPSNAGNLL